MELTQPDINKMDPLWLYRAKEEIKWIIDNIDGLVATRQKELQDKLRVVNLENSAGTKENKKPPESGGD